MVKKKSKLKKADLLPELKVGRERVKVKHVVLLSEEDKASSALTNIARRQAEKYNFESVVTRTYVNIVDGLRDVKPDILVICGILPISNKLTYNRKLYMAANDLHIILRTIMTPDEHRAREVGKTIKKMLGTFIHRRHGKKVHTKRRINGATLVIAGASDYAKKYKKEWADVFATLFAGVAKPRKGLEHDVQ